MKIWTLLLCVSLFCVVSAGAGHAAEYVSSKKCKMCHMKQFKGWEKTKMAKAFEGLKPGVAAEAKTAAGLDPEKDYTSDASCLGCHTTNGKADRPGVGCQGCHGPGSEYMKVMMTNRDYRKDEIMGKGLMDPKESCSRCHNEKSPFFKGFTFDRNQGIHEHFPLKKQH